MRAARAQREAARMRNPMFVFDERVADLVFAHCAERLSLDPVPLDYGSHDVSSSDLLDGLLGPLGNDPQEVLDLFTERLAAAVVSHDSPGSSPSSPRRPRRRPSSSTWSSRARR